MLDRTAASSPRWGSSSPAGADGADAPVRWVHISELPDPTPWLSGGELLLTTGIQLDTPSAPARVRAAACRAPPGRARLRHRLRPRDAARGAGRARRTQLGFPVFEVPYELPFIALTEKAFTRLVNEQYEVLQRGIAIHKRLERLVLEERGLDEVVRALAAATGGAVCVLSRPRRDDRLQGVPAPAARRRRWSRCATRWRGAASSSRTAATRGRERRVRARPSGDRRPLARAARVDPRPRRPAGLAGGRARLRRARRLRAADPPAGRDRRGARADAPARDARHRAAPRRRRAGGGAHRAPVGGGAAPCGCGRSASARTRPCSCSPATDGAPPPRPRPSSTASSPTPACGALVAPRERLLCAVVDAREGIDPVALAGRRARRSTEARRRCAPRPRARRRWARCAARFHEARCALEAAALAERLRARGGLLPRPRRVPAAALAAGRRRAAALLRQRARPARGRERRVRRRADPLARDVHRAERPVGARRARALLPPAYAALPDPAGGAAHRARPVERARPDRVLAGAAGARAGS